MTPEERETRVTYLELCSYLEQATSDEQGNETYTLVVPEDRIEPLRNRIYIELGKIHRALQNIPDPENSPLQFYWTYYSNLIEELDSIE